MTKLVFCILFFINSALAVNLPFANCLESSIINSAARLQFVPLIVDVKFDTINAQEALNITVYGNVTSDGSYPPNDPAWTDPNITAGKIVNVSTSNLYTTLFEQYQFLNYDAFNAPASQFCASVIGSTECPLAPSFNGNISDPSSLSAFSVSHSLNTSFSFATIQSLLRIKSGDKPAVDLGCISTRITPDLGPKVSGLLHYLPVVVLIFTGLATLAAAIFSPWGTSDPFKWTTNYGRDEDLLRLVTPGFGDCLHYIQFIFLTGALSLNYPGYYQPAASKAAWSSLSFNESFVTRGGSYHSLVDGVYITNSTLGLTRMTQLIGMSTPTDAWACMAVWLAVLCLIAVVLCQATFIARRAYFRYQKTTPEDLSRKNWPLTGGMLVRLIYNYFLLPITAWSFFQLVIAQRTRFYLLLLAIILLLVIVIMACWILRIIIDRKRRAQIFDHLPTLLLYGSLYNTYSDQMASFAIVPALLTFVRGLAIGAVQYSGIAQVVLLAICEIVYILLVHAFRPFSSPTHMNLMHTGFAGVRLITVLLLATFVPSLSLSEGSRGWIGYIILLLHGMVLVFGFFMNSIQTLIEVVARRFGVAGDAQHGAQRGALISYGWRQLRNRQPSRPAARPGSMASMTAMLSSDVESNKFEMDRRSRSYSANSAALLSYRHSSGTDLNGSPLGHGRDSSYDAIDATYGGQGLATTNSGTKRMSLLQSDPYYRPPRARRLTLEPGTPLSVTRSRYSTQTNDWGINDLVEDDQLPGPSPNEDSGDQQSKNNDSDSPEGGSSNVTRTQSGTDYATREVDYYYGHHRGPALSSQPFRKHKTGPVDPMNPRTSGTTWLQRLLLVGPKKPQNKGFEVVRSSRAPVQPASQTHNEAGVAAGEEIQPSPIDQYPKYKDIETQIPTQQVAGQVDGQVDDNNDDERNIHPAFRHSAASAFETSRTSQDRSSLHSFGSPILNRSSSDQTFEIFSTINHNTAPRLPPLSINTGSTLSSSIPGLSRPASRHTRFNSSVSSAKLGLMHESEERESDVNTPYHDVTPTLGTNTTEMLKDHHLKVTGQAGEIPDVPRKSSKRRTLSRDIDADYAMKFAGLDSPIL